MTQSSGVLSTPRGQQEADAPRDYWNAKGPEIAFGQETFRLTWMRKSGALNISTYVESFTWTEDDTGIPKGELQTRTPGTLDPLNLQPGEQVKCEVQPRPGGAWSEVWRMRVSTPTRDYGDGSTRVSLVNDLALLEQSEDDFIYKRDRKHPSGWTLTQIVADVAQRYGIARIVCPASKHRIKKLTIVDDSGNAVTDANSLLRVSPLDVILSAVKTEMRATDTPYHVRLEKGVLYVLPRRRSELLIAIGDQIIEAALASTLGDDRKPFASAVTVRNTGEDDAGTDTKNRKKKKVRKIVAKVSIPTSVSRFGYVHRNVYAQDADTVAEARQLGALYLKRLAMPQNELTITHPGIWTVRRFDAMRVKLGDPVLKNKIVFVNAVTHSVSASAYTMALTLQFEDPFVADADEKVTEEIEAVAAEKGRKTTTKKKTSPSPTTNTKRAEDPTPFSTAVGAAGRA